MKNVLCYTKGISMMVTFAFFFTGAHADPQKIVNVYNWAYGLTPEILQQFETETGIKVNYDVYDSPEVMETKLLAGHAGYDVVAVTIWPYLARQLEAHLYQPLQPALISNWKEVDTDLLKRMEDVDPGNRFALPLLWGTSGFAINQKMIQKRYPNAPIQSADMLFDPSVVSRFADCGVMLIDSPLDVIPAVLNYLKKDPNSENLEELKAAGQALLHIRPFIRKFQPLPSASALISEDYCLVEGFSGELLQAEILGKESGLDISYVIPTEGGSLWVDGLAIPQDAPHVAEAHAFINFILRPDVIAQVTNATETANSVPASRAFIKERIKTNPLVFPSQEVMKKLYVDKNHPPRYERLRLREWTRVKTGR
jgi:putrescine transport system substrate-binding protein